MALSPENLSRATVLLAKRRDPLLVSRSTDLEVEVTVELPDSWTLHARPADAEVEARLLRYRRTTQASRTGLRITKSCSLSAGLIGAQEYPAWVGAAQDVDRADRLELVLKRPAQ